MKVLIVGGTSSIAQALQPKLAEFCEVITAGRTNCNITLQLSDSIENITFPNDVDVVIHTAAHFGGKTAAEIIEAENINVLGTMKLCQAAVNASVKHFMYISSIFSNASPNDNNYSVYSISKKHSEELATYYCSLNNLPLTILKPSHLYGLQDGFRKHQPFFYSILDKAKNNEDLSLYGNNDPIRNFLFIEDLTDIIVKVMQQKVTGSFSCTQMNDVTYTQIAAAAYKIYGTNGKVSFLNDKPDIPSFKYDKDDALYQKIGFFPQVNLEQGIQKLANNSNHSL
ncbi:NAD(P)-dependent oxidoreductase [Flavobacterium sp.]|uniref:NAD-dependent epimerase/dehydratase family protein n=1 Tax=Flavobacterium sp. TaxID=239 RepID=UPI00286C1B43|nr:NAD(P)-dependent oxidoreductase [Flavobacterium sp.]